MPDDDILDELDLGPRGPGRPPKSPPHIEYARDLTRADIAALSAPRSTVPASLRRIHASHHSLARCLASGMRPAQAALVTGYSNSRISILQNDPAFQALVAEYQAEARSIFADLSERMNDLSLDAIEMLHERLHDSPEDFSVPMLLDVVKAFADRTGRGPNQNVNVNVKMGRDLIDRPPRESFEDWERRRRDELKSPSDMSDVPALPAPRKLN